MSHWRGLTIIVISWRTLRSSWSDSSCWLCCVCLVLWCLQLLVPKESYMLITYLWMMPLSTLWFYPSTRSWLSVRQWVHQWQSLAIDEARIIFFNACFWVYSHEAFEHLLQAMVVWHYANSVKLLLGDGDASGENLAKVSPKVITCKVSAVVALDLLKGYNTAGARRTFSSAQAWVNAPGNVARFFQACKH